MNAQLKPVAPTVAKPAYDNTQKVFCLWYARNEQALLDYYAELGRALPQDADDNLLATARAERFLSFARCQFDIAHGRFM